MEKQYKIELSEQFIYYLKNFKIFSLVPILPNANKESFEKHYISSKVLKLLLQ